VKVSYDTNLRLRLWDLDARARPSTPPARAATSLLPSLDDSQQLTGLADRDAIADFYLKLGAPLVALKMGERGRPARHDPGRAARARRIASRRSTRPAPATPSTALPGAPARGRRARDGGALRQCRRRPLDRGLRRRDAHPAQGRGTAASMARAETRQRGADERAEDRQSAGRPSRGRCRHRCRDRRRPVGRCLPS
jgi:hypothetical protein